MTPNEAIAIVEAKDGDSVQYTLPLEPVGKVLVGEIRRLWQMESQIQGHPLVCGQPADSTVERVQIVLDEKIIEVQHLLEAVIKRDKEIRRLREEVELLTDRLQHGG